MRLRRQWPIRRFQSKFLLILFRLLYRRDRSLSVASQTSTSQKQWMQNTQFKLWIFIAIITIAQQDHITSFHISQCLNQFKRNYVLYLWNGRQWNKGAAPNQWYCKLWQPDGQLNNFHPINAETIFQEIKRDSKQGFYFDWRFFFRFMTHAADYFFCRAQSAFMGLMKRLDIGRWTMWGIFHWWRTKIGKCQIANRG